MKKTLLTLLLLIPLMIGAQPTLEQLKQQAQDRIDENAKMAQVMVDKVFSFAELGFQEYETSKYLTDILKESGFEIEDGISGVPTAWWAKWGSGKPVIALGSDIQSGNFNGVNT